MNYNPLAAEEVSEPRPKISWHIELSVQSHELSAKLLQIPYLLLDTSRNPSGAQSHQILVVLEQLFVAATEVWSLLLHLSLSSVAPYTCAKESGGNKHTKNS